MRLQERVEEPRHQLRETELKIEEADVPEVPLKVYAPSPEEYSRQQSREYHQRSRVLEGSDQVRSRSSNQEQGKERC